MKVRVLGAYGGNTKRTYLTNFLINDVLAMDAGCLTSTLDLEEQYRIRNVLVSHSHMDHITSLPFLADNVFGETDETLKIWASDHVIQCLKKHIFNDVIWPDFSSIHYEGRPCISFHSLEAFHSYTIAGLQITPIPVNHLVPTFAFYVEDAKSGFLFTSDTTTTDRVWSEMNGKEKLKAIIVDCSFPNSLNDLALKSGHMTPELLAADLKKLNRDCRILVYHAKPSFESQLKQELKDAGLGHIQADIQGECFEF